MSFFNACTTQRAIAWDPCASERSLDPCGQGQRSLYEDTQDPRSFLYMVRDATPRPVAVTPVPHFRDAVFQTIPPSNAPPWLSYTVANSRNLEFIDGPQYWR